MKPRNNSNEWNITPPIFNNFSLDRKNKQIILNNPENFQGRVTRPENREKLIELDDELAKIHNILYPENRLDLSTTHYIKNIFIHNNEIFYDDEWIYQIEKNWEKSYLYGKIAPKIQEEQGEVRKFTDILIATKDDLMAAETLNSEIKNNVLLNGAIFVDVKNWTFKHNFPNNLADNIVREIYAIINWKNKDKNFIFTFFDNYKWLKIPPQEEIMIKWGNMYNKEWNPIVEEKKF